MVFPSKILFDTQVKNVRKFLRSKFIDTLRLHLRAGTGGNGLPKYGGAGGKGGSIYVTATEKETLKSVLRRWPTKRVKAGHGGNSHAKRILGELGADENIDVPVGITVYHENGKKIADLNEEGKKVVVAKGGIGGYHRSEYMGLKGQTHTITLDLKLIADIGLVGFPNAGKSTFLKAVSNAKPRIASYPFTTIKPNIGVMEYTDLRRISVADLPGLIEGAHVNIGMGHRFLKHVERTKLLLLIVDINGFQLSPQYKFRSCLETIILLNKELELYKSELLDKPAVILINKMDLDGAEQNYNEIKDKIKNLPDTIKAFPEIMQPERPIVFDDIIPISAKYAVKDVDYVKYRLRQILDLHADLKREQERDESTEKIIELETNLKAKGPQLI